MSKPTHQKCVYVREDGSKCGGNPKKGDQYCYWCKKKGRDGSGSQVVSLADKRREIEATASDVDRDRLIDEFLFKVAMGEQKESRQTSSGKVYEAEPQIKDRISAAREYRARRGRDEDAGNKFRRAVEDIMSDILGV